MIKQNQLSASMEDYLEAMYELSDDNGLVRSIDIAKMLCVKKPSVTSAVKWLADKGLLNYKPYEQLSLTESGIKEAKRIVRKHNIIKSFFVNILGVDDETSHKAACKAEHALGPAVISKLLLFNEYVSTENTKGNDLVKNFRKYCSMSKKAEK